MLKLNGLKLLHFKNSQNAQTVEIPLPKTVRIPMQQHMGKPCTPTVAVGDTVRVGNASATARKSLLCRSTARSPER